MRSPLRDLLLVVRAFRESGRGLRPLLGRVDDELGPALRSVDAYHRAGADVAMFLCRIDPRQLDALDPITPLALRIRALGGELIELDRLPPDQLERLTQRILPRCEVRTPGLPSLGAALDALAPPASPAAAPSPSRSAPPTPSTVRLAATAPLAGDPPPRLRFQRGSSWQVGRLGRIQGDRLDVVASAPLRAGERTVLEIAAPSVAARLAVEVIDDARCAAPGTWGFAVRIVPDGPRRATDANVLAWARARLAGARPLPPRAEHRIPLAWPARLRDQTGEHLVTVRDVSRGGVFAEMPRMPEGSVIQLRVPFDLGDAPLELAAEVARVVDPEQAARHGVPTGVGLRVRPSARDTDRYPAFVDRVTQRASRHVLIGARPPRLDELVRHFASVGYLVTGCDDVRGLCARATEGARQPEVVLVDARLSTPEHVRPRLGRRGIPVLAIDGGVVEARRLVDAALLTT